MLIIPTSPNKNNTEFLLVVRHELEMLFGVKVPIQSFLTHPKPADHLWVFSTAEIHLLQNAKARPCKFILFQLEPLHKMFNKVALGKLINKASMVFEYAYHAHASPHYYIPSLLSHVKNVPIGYSNIYESLHQAKGAKQNKDLECDVFAFGRRFLRRKIVLDKCADLGMKIKLLKVYGVDLANHLVNAKITLAVYSKANFFTTDFYRVIPLISNKMFVVCEQSILPDSQQDQMLRDLGVICVPYEDIPAQCKYYIDHPEERCALSESIYKKLTNSFTYQSFLKPHKKEILDLMKSIESKK